jgi:hypothetical protein
LSLSDCLAQGAEDIDVDLLPRRTYLQKYRPFAGTMADEVVPGRIFLTEDSAPAGFRIGGLEYSPSALLDLGEEFLPLPVVKAYAMPLGSFLPGGGVFGGFGAGFSPAEEETTLYLSDEAGGRARFDEGAPVIWEDLLTEGDGLDFPLDFSMIVRDEAGETAG